MKYEATITELLFLRFQTLYGNRLTTMWGDAEPEAVKEAWAQALNEFTGPDLKAALETVKRECLDYPPTLPRFVSFCRDAQRVRQQNTPKLPGPKTVMPAGLCDKLRTFLNGAGRKA